MNKNIKSCFIGGLIGILISTVIIMLHKNLGNSNALVAVAGFIKSFFVNHKVFESSKYYKIYMINRPIFEIQFMTIIGIIIGAFVSSKIRGAKKENIPTLWIKNFGKSKLKRFLIASFGGFLVGFGARIADGCMSGLGLSSGIKLATTAWIFMITVFIAAIITANLIYNRKKDLKLRSK